MGTQSAIGSLSVNGTVTGIYCNYDGYIQGVGHILHYHYESPHAVSSLLNLGNLSKLADTVNSTESYFRDRQETNECARVFANLDDFERYFRTSMYYYIYDGVEWLYKKAASEDKSYHSLASAIKILQCNK